MIRFKRLQLCLQLDLIEVDNGQDSDCTARLFVNIVYSIQGLLSKPNPDDPLLEDVAQQWKENTEEAHRVAREWTSMYASG